MKLVNIMKGVKQSDRNFTQLTTDTVVTLSNYFKFTKVTHKIITNIFSYDGHITVVLNLLTTVTPFS